MGWQNPTKATEALSTSQKKLKRGFGRFHQLGQLGGADFLQQGAQAEVGRIQKVDPQFWTPILLSTRDLKIISNFWYL